MKWIPKYQKAGKLNFKTTGLPWQQSGQDQEITRNAQSTGTLNSTNLKSRLQPAAKNLKAKYNKLSTKERLALAKQSMPHSEIVTVRDQQGNTKTDTNPQAGAMSGADPVGEFIVGTAAGNLGLGLGKMALSKMGQNAISHWARNSLLNETAGNLTKNIATPLIESEAVPLEDGFVYRTFTPSHGGWVKDGRIYNRSYGLGDVRIQDGKYYSVRQAHFNNPDKLWWDKLGHNRGQVVQVTNEANTQTLQDAAKNGFNLNYGSFEKGYRLSDPIKTNEVINYKLDPLTNTMVPSMPGKIINNKQTPSEILSAPIVNNYSYLNGTYTGFKGIKPKLNHHLQGEDAVKMFKEYGGTPIPEGSLNGDQLRKYVMEARERYGLIDNPNISDEEIAQALYKHTNELGKGSAAINSQGEPQLLFRGDTKPYNKLKVNHNQIGKSDTEDNVLGTMFLDRTGIGEGWGPDRYMYLANQDNKVMAPYRNGIETASFTTLQPRFKPDYITPVEGKGFVDDSDISYPYYKYDRRYGVISGGKISSEAFADGYTNQLNGFVVRTPHERDITNEVYTNGMYRTPKAGEEFQWRVPHTTDISSAPRETRILQNKAIIKDAQQKNQGLLRSKAGSPYRDEHDKYDYLVVPDFNARNVKHILPYDLRIPRNWSDPNIFRIAAPIGMSLPFLNNSQK